MATNPALASTRQPSTSWEANYNHLGKLSVLDCGEAKFAARVTGDTATITIGASAFRTASTSVAVLNRIFCMSFLTF
ncbi:UNVERIFIED_ORG: hypothetical protein M2328_006448 [Rhodococcus erythropolis]